MANLKRKQSHHHHHAMPPNLLLNEQDAASNQTVGMSDEVKIVLQEEPAKGLKWIITNLSDHFLLSDEAKKTFNDKNEYRQFVFVAKKTGVAEVSLVYKNGWDKDAPVLKNLTYTITID